MLDWPCQSAEDIEVRRLDAQAEMNVKGYAENKLRALLLHNKHLASTRADLELKLLQERTAVSQLTLAVSALENQLERIQISRVAPESFAIGVQTLSLIHI